MELYVDDVLPPAVQAERYLKLITGRWREAVRVQVAPTAADLPVPAPSDARGLCTQDGVWLVAGQSRVSLARTLAHEAVAHHGLRRHLGDGWGDFMSAVHEGARGGDEHLVDVIAAVRWAYEDQQMPSGGVADEALAAIVERSVNHRTGAFEPSWPTFKLVLAGWRQAQRDLLHLEVAASYAEAEGALLAAQRRMHRGGALLGIGWRLRRWYPAPMSKPLGSSVPPRDLEESAEWLRNAEDDAHRWDWVKTLPGRLLIWLVIAVGLVFWLSGAFGVFGVLSGVSRLLGR